jgi:hypothetical protein
MEKNRKILWPKEQLCTNISTPNKDPSSKTITESIYHRIAKSYGEEARRNPNV